MGLFEWLVVGLLALILLRTGGKDQTREKEAIDSLRLIEALLNRIESQLSEIEASVNSASHDISAIRISQLPDYPPDGP